MKIAVTTQGDQIFQHFGQCQSFSIFTVEGGEVKDKSILDSSQNGHAALSGFLKASGVNVVICGGIGDGARQMLAAAGIELLSGLKGKIDDSVNAYLSGELADMGGGCNHEEHGADHVCNCKNHH